MNNMKNFYHFLAKITLASVSVNGRMQRGKLKPKQDVKYKNEIMFNFSHQRNARSSFDLFGTGYSRYLPLLSVILSLCFSFFSFLFSKLTARSAASAFTHVDNEHQQRRGRRACIARLIHADNSESHESLANDTLSFMQYAFVTSVRTHMTFTEGFNSLLNAKFPALSCVAASAAMLLFQTANGDIAQYGIYEVSGKTEIANLREDQT